MIRIIFFTVFASALLNFAKAQQLSAIQVENIINSRHFTFEAITMNPQGGTTRQLTPGNSLKIAGDSLISALPYFGKAYTAPINPADVGYDFTTVKFDYKVAARKKDSYEIKMRTKDNVYNPDFTLTIYNNGTAYLQVNSSDRQPISFRGYIK